MQADYTGYEKQPAKHNHSYPPDAEMIQLMEQLGNYTQVAGACSVKPSSLRDYLRIRPILKAAMEAVARTPGPNRPKYKTEEERREARIQSKCRYFKKLKETDPEKYRKWARDSAKRKSPEQRAKWNNYNRLRRKELGLATNLKMVVDLPPHLWTDPCSYCGKPGGTADHIVPLQHGGELGEENLTAACQSCNSSKNDKSLLKFLIYRKGISC